MRRSSLNGDIAPALRAIGTLAGMTATTEKAIQQFTRRLAAMRQQYSTQKTVKVFFEIWRNPLMTVGNSQLISDVISPCGGQNLYNNIDKAIPTGSLESLIARNPQVIVTSGYHNNDLASYWSQYSIIEAVNKQQFLVPPGDLITRATPRVLEGAALLCNYLQSMTVKQQEVRHCNLLHPPSRYYCLYAQRFVQHILLQTK